MNDVTTDSAAATNLSARRAVLIGASNLTRGMATSLKTVQTIWPQPIEMLVAAGLGRSYGLTSRILGRALPSILTCGLWERLEQGPSLPTAALLTDVGNDLLYGASVKQLVSWVETCLERLQPFCETVVLARLPLSSLDRLGDFKYAMMRRLLFPGSQLTRKETVSRAVEVDLQLVDLAEKHGISTVQPSLEWYGFDPIHIRRAHYETAWSCLLQGWKPEKKMLGAKTSWLQRCYFRWQGPYQRHLFGKLQIRNQPSVSFVNGSTVSFY